MNEPRPLAPGALPLAGRNVQIAQPLGRVGDGLIYLALDGARQARLREYAPAGLVRRLPDGTLHPADPRFAYAWADGAARFLDQGHRLAALDHPGIAPIWRAASVEEDGVRQGAYLVGAPVGEPLSAALAGGLRLPPSAILDVAAELVDALAHVHASGLTHLDIAPQTVSLASGRLELTDFAVDNRPYLGLLESQAGLVRPGYSPIEHHDASMAEPLGAPADVYAASALLFRLITGRDPAPWQDRWRDPAASTLPDLEDYPRAFLAAIRTGMAIEPQDRFPDGAHWAAAMALPPALRHAPPAPVQHQPPPPQPARAKRRSAFPLLLLTLLAIALAYLAYTQGWFAPTEADSPPGNQVTAKLPPPERLHPPEEETPSIQPGTTVSGQLGPGDGRRGGGQYEDRFILSGRAGDRLEIRLSAAAFDPLLTVSGPGFQAANDDDAAAGSRDARLLITLPRAGRYTLSVSSYARGGAGNYLLEVETAPPLPSATAPTTLTGRWRRTDDPACASPASISVEGGDLVIDYRGTQSRERLVDAPGSASARVIRTRRAATAGGTERGYRLSADGDRFDLDNGTWLRC